MADTLDCDVDISMKKAIGTASLTSSYLSLDTNLLVSQFSSQK